MIKITKPIYVKRARQWCVTVVNGTKQNQEWFSTEVEAKEWIKLQKEVK